MLRHCCAASSHLQGQMTPQQGGMRGPGMHRCPHAIPPARHTHAHTPLQNISSHTQQGQHDAAATVDPLCDQQHMCLTSLRDPTRTAWTGWPGCSRVFTPTCSTRARLLPSTAYTPLSASAAACTWHRYSASTRRGSASSTARRHAPHIAPITWRAHGTHNSGAAQWSCEQREDDGTSGQVQASHPCSAGSGPACFLTERVARKSTTIYSTAVAMLLLSPSSVLIPSVPHLS